MEHGRDEALLMGQAAGLIAVMSALVQASPPSTRKRMLEKLRPQFESLFAAMRTSGMTEAQTELKVAEWVRDLFLSQILKAEKKQKVPESSRPAVEALDFEL